MRGERFRTGLAAVQEAVYDLITAPEGVEKRLGEMGCPPRDLESLVKPSVTMSSVERLDVYANMYFYRILDVLRDEYSKVRAVLGDDMFHNLITGYLVECRPAHLLQFAVMGSVFAQVLLGLDKPKVGLLNVGSEELKGHEELRQAAAWLRSEGSPVDFHGFVEGNDIGTGNIDVVVTEGFTGNVALKTIEGTAKLYTQFVRDAFRTSTFAKIGYLFAAGAWKKLRKRVDPRRYNGGVFLGLDGVCVKSHGGTDQLGFAYAIGVARDLVRYEYKSKLVEGLAKLRQVTSAPDTPEEALQASGGTA